MPQNRTWEAGVIGTDRFNDLTKIQPTPLKTGDTIVPPSNFNYRMKVEEIHSNGTLTVSIGNRKFPWSYPFQKLNCINN